MFPSHDRAVDAQGYGSCVTYARRYALQSALGLSPEDDDGNAASRPANRNEPDETISDSDRDALQTMIEASPKTTQEICELYKIGSLKELPAKVLPKLKSRLVELTKEAA